MMNWSPNNIHYLLLTAYAFTLPFNEPYSKLTNVIMLLLAANWLRVHRFSFRPFTAILMLLFYVLHIMGLWYTENMEQGIFELDKKISFLIFPVVLPAFTISPESMRKILSAFAWGTTAASLVCLAYACLQFIAHGNTDYFYYHPLTEIIDMHAIYMAMYVSFSIFIVIYYNFMKAMAGTPRLKGGFVLLLMYLVFFVFLLSARTIILTFSLIVFAAIIAYGYQKRKLALATMICTVVLALFAALIFLNDNNRERFKEAINYNSEYNIERQYGGRSTRELIWNCASIVISENPLLGYGTGDAQDILHECYLQNDFGPLTYLPDLRYNAHSQYLQSWIDLGLLGISVFILILVSPLVKVLRQGDVLFLSFIVLFALACSTESMLELSQGITFFSFFHCLLLQRQSFRQAVAFPS